MPKHPGDSGRSKRFELEFAPGGFYLTLMPLRLAMLSVLPSAMLQSYV